MLTDPNAPRRGVILVGHGGVPKDYPRPRLMQLKALEARRRAAAAEPGAEETQLEHEIRHWPRTAESDPYRAGIEALAARLRPLLDGADLVVAYNEFCAPTVEEAAEQLVAAGIRSIRVVPSMLTPGGVHSEVEIPESLERVRRSHPELEIRYAWPFDLDRVAAMLAEQVG